MGETNWTVFTDSLATASLDRGVTTGVARPNGGGSFVYGFNSLVVATGAAALFANQANFVPTAANKGGRITGAIKRGVSGGPTGFAPFFALLAQGTSVNDNAYLIGLQNDDPYRIVIRKGTMVSGLPAAIPGAQGILRRSTSTFSPDTWHHLRFDAVVNLNGDVILKAWSNDLVANAVTAPVWTAIPGLEDSALVSSHGAGSCFVDDALGINSGSQPYTSGRLGFGFQMSDVSRRGFFDHVEIIRQT